MARGGYHAHAERWGRKSAWKNGSATKTIRVPGELAEQILDLAHRLDEKGFIASDTKSIQDLVDQEDEDLDEELDEDDTEPSDDEVIRVQAEQNQKLLTEVRFLEREQAELESKLRVAQTEIAQLRSQLEELDSLKPPAVDLERIRESVLVSLRVGKQSTEYKRAKLVLDRFIGHYNCRSRK